MAFPQKLRVIILEKLHWRSGKSKSCILFGRYHPFTLCKQKCSQVYRDH